MITRKFLPGAEWLYIKIYSGAKTSDLILQESATQLVENLKQENLIEKWFFIRYSDPKPHIRLRFLLCRRSSLDIVLEKINLELQEFLASGEIISFLLDTYVRELERYGFNTIDYAESLFSYSSDLVLNLLGCDDEEKLMMSVFYINNFLSKLKWSETEKANWLLSIDSAFKAEFNADKHLKNQLVKKYAAFKSKYEDFLHSEDFEEFRNLILLNLAKSEKILEKLLLLQSDNSLQVSLYTFFQSIFHMHINRIFHSNQRLFEMIIYDFLLRENKTRLAIPNHF